jgi:hypothetical protein
MESAVPLGSIVIAASDANLRAWHVRRGHQLAHQLATTAENGIDMHRQALSNLRRQAPALCIEDPEQAASSVP